MVNVSHDGLTSQPKTRLSQRRNAGPHCGHSLEWFHEILFLYFTTVIRFEMPTYMYQIIRLSLFYIMNWHQWGRDILITNYALKVNYVLL